MSPSSRRKQRNEQEELSQRFEELIVLLSEIGHPETQNARVGGATQTLSTRDELSVVRRLVLPTVAERRP